MPLVKDLVEVDEVHGYLLYKFLLELVLIFLYLYYGNFICVLLYYVEVFLFLVFS